MSDLRADEWRLVYPDGREFVRAKVGEEVRRPDGLILIAEYGGTDLWGAVEFSKTNTNEPA